VAAAPGERAWPAETLWRVRAASGGCALVEVTLRTGVTHQARVHLALAGHPVLGDLLYGGPAVDLPAGRHALHACALAFPHPEHGTLVRATSALPADLAALVPR
jgi:23S rRNA-/tRNA-specific pseudouridylate synthase